jgi:preprotein translocase subunit YajC
VEALFPLLLLGLAFVVLIVLPMRARQRVALQTQQLKQSLTLGQEIMTTSGLYGRIVALDERTVDLEIAPDVVVRWNRLAVSEVRRPEPGADADADESGKPTEE